MSVDPKCDPRMVTWTAGWAGQAAPSLQRPLYALHSERWLFYTPKDFFPAARSHVKEEMNCAERWKLIANITITPRFSESMCFRQLLFCLSSWLQLCLDQNQVPRAGFPWDRPPSFYLFSVCHTFLMLTAFQALSLLPEHRVRSIFANMSSFGRRGDVCLFDFALFLLLLLLLYWRWNLLIIYLIWVPVIQASKMHVSK